MSDYKKQTWVDEETPVDAEHLNHIEDGITDAQNTTDEALETANEAKETAESVKDSVPTKTSELDNDSGYITDDALDGYAKESDVESVKETADSALEKATETAESAITGINVNGTAQPVNDNIAELTIEEGGGAIEHIQVNGTEQPIEDKTVNLDIDRASVDDETLIVGDTTGGQNFTMGSLASGETLTLEWDFALIIFKDRYGDNCVFVSTGYIYSLLDNPDLVTTNGQTITARTALDYMVIHN